MPGMLPESTHRWQPYCSMNFESPARKLEKFVLKCLYIQIRHSCRISSSIVKVYIELLLTKAIRTSKLQKLDTKKSYSSSVPIFRKTCHNFQSKWHSNPNQYVWHKLVVQDLNKHSVLLVLGLHNSILKFVLLGMWWRGPNSMTLYGFLCTNVDLLPLKHKQQLNNARSSVGTHWWVK